MSKLEPTKDSRTTYDKKTGAVRSFFGAELVAPISETKRALSPAEKSDDFLEVNRNLFKLKDVSLQKSDVREGADTRSVRYLQMHKGIPVYGAQLVVGQRKQDGAIISAVNEVDYNVPAKLDPDKIAIKADEAMAAVQKKFSARFENLEIGSPALYVYRHVTDDVFEPTFPLPAIRREMLEKSAGVPGQIYIVWRMLMDTRNPSGSWELFIDAMNGAVVAVKDRRRYASRKGFIFWPDPIRSSQNSNLSWNTSENTLNNERVEKDIENLDAPVSGKYKLDGAWVRVRDKEAPDFAPPETTGDFKYPSKSREFLCVMAYYYLDRLISDLRGFNVTSFNGAVTGPIQVDAQGCDGDDQSWFTTDINGNPYIAHGEGGVPDASDPGVIVHEYGHAIHSFLASNQTYANEHIFCDFLATAWIDRYNEKQFAREEMFPWDNNSHTQWSTWRRVNLTERFDDVGYSGYPDTKKGAIGATALWDLFLNIGGNSPYPDVRRWAADEAIRTYMNMLVTVANNTSTENLINGLITADEARTGGLYKKVIWDAFRRRGLWNEFTPTGNVDLYVRDSDTDIGEHASPQLHWTSPDIWVRNSPPPADPNDPNDPNYGENPDDGHQSPINNAPNYLYVRVRNRGSQQSPANAFTLEAFHCNPATAMLWPDHFQSMGTLPITSAIPANGGSVRIGPFIWTPQIVDHECLLVVVKGANDQTIADTVKAKGSVDHWKLVRFDNNVGQRNVKPAPSTPGGKTRTSFLIRGTTHPSTNTLRLDTSTLPPDTKISVRVARTITDQAEGLSGFILSGQNSRWSTLSLAGGTVGTIDGFPLATHEEKSVTLDIDFSYQAENLKRYPIVAGQVQDGVLAGQLTIEITAVKESEDYVYGNARSREMHTLNCVYRKKMKPYNQVPFETIKDGLARGYNGCAFCMPEYNTD